MQIRAVPNAISEAKELLQTNPAVKAKVFMLNYTNGMVLLH